MDNNTQNQTPATPVVDAGVTVPTDQPVAPVPVDPMDAAAQMPSFPTAPVGTGDLTGQVVAPAAPQPVAIPDPMAAPVPTDQSVAQPAMPAIPAMPMDTQSPAAEPATDVNAPVIPGIPIVDTTAAVAPVTPVMSAPMQMGPVTNEELMEELQRIEDRLDEIDEKL